MISDKQTRTILLAKPATNKSPEHYQLNTIPVKPETTMYIVEQLSYIMKNCYMFVVENDFMRLTVKGVNVSNFSDLSYMCLF